MQWDDFSGAGLLYMHARHYSPLTGRFLQPDPSAAETNLYGYAGDSPVTKTDPSGLFYYRVRYGDTIYRPRPRMRWHRAPHGRSSVDTLGGRALDSRQRS